MDECFDKNWSYANSIFVHRDLEKFLHLALPWTYTALLFTCPYYLQYGHGFVSTFPFQVLLLTKLNFYIKISRSLSTPSSRRQATWCSIRLLFPTLAFPEPGASLARSPSPFGCPLLISTVVIGRWVTAEGAVRISYEILDRPLASKWLIISLCFHTRPSVS